MAHSGLRHIVKFEPGFDCIRFQCKHGSKDCQPGTGGSHGRSGLAIRFVSKGDAGAVQFLLWTNWGPQHSKDDDIGVRRLVFSPDNPCPADLGYHSKKPHYEGQLFVDDGCEFCDGKPCYYDGSSLNSYLAMYALVNGGDEGLWKFLDEYYRHVFEGGDFPEPVEYPALPRDEG